MATVRDFRVNNGLEVAVNANVVSNTTALDYIANTTGVTISPSVTFDFTNSKVLDSRITFIRASSATYRAANGLIAYANNNVPRFDYNSNGVCNGLLIEQSRTNELLYTTNVGNTLFYGINGGIPGAQACRYNVPEVAAPDGSNTASYFYHATNQSSYKSLDFSLTVTSNRVYTHSFFVKANNEPYVSTVHYDGLDAINTITFRYHFANNTFGPVSVGGSANCAVVAGPRAEPYANGWVRISYTYRYTNGTTRYLGHKIDLDYDAAVVGRGVYVWGEQLEWNDKPTTFIPTTTNAVTRANDLAYVDGLNSSNLGWYNPAEGTVRVKWSVPVTATTNNALAVAYSGYPGPICFWQADDSTNVSHHIFYADATGGKGAGIERFVRGNNIMYLSVPGVSNGAVLNTTYSYSNTDFATATNGGSYANTGVTGNTYPATTRMEIGRSRANWLDGYVKRIDYWPRKLANTNITISSI